MCFCTIKLHLLTTSEHSIQVSQTASHDVLWSWNPFSFLLFSFCYHISAESEAHRNWKGISLTASSTLDVLEIWNLIKLLFYYLFLGIREWIWSLRSWIGIEEGLKNHGIKKVWSSLILKTLPPCPAHSLCKGAQGNMNNGLKSFL